MNTPPHSIETESALLGCALVNESACSYAIDNLSPIDFYDPKHRLIFEAILTLRGESKPVDYLTLKFALERAQKLTVVGLDYIAKLNSLALPFNAKDYVKIVKELSKARELIRVCERATASAYKQSKPVSELIDAVESRIYEISHGELRQGGVMESAGQALPKAIEFIRERIENKGRLMGLRSGLVELDFKTNGWKAGELIVLAARPSVGKTALALQFAMETALDDKATAFFSLEMPTQSLLVRLLGNECQVDTNNIMRGQLNDSEFNRLAQKAQKFADLPLFLYDRSDLSVSQAHQLCRRLAKKQKLGLIVIDYLQLMKPPPGKFESKTVEIGTMSRALKVMARELEVPVILISQLSRDSTKTNRRPQLSDLRYSGDIEQDADMVMFLHRPLAEDEARPRDQNIELLLEKNRNGPIGIINLVFQSAFQRFTPLNNTKESDI